MPINFVCPACFGASGLKRRIEKIRPKYPDENCSLHETRKGVPVDAVAKIVDRVFRDNYGLGQYNPYLDDGEGEDLLTTLYTLTEADDDKVVQALMKALEEGDNYWPGDGENAFYSNELNYVPSDHALGTHSRLWDSFCEQIVYGQRFFNAEARAAVEEIFSKIHLLRDGEGCPPIHTLQPGKPNAMFFRARIANDDKTRTEICDDTAAYLGPPPQRLRRAGRMNASGVSAFYGAFEEGTAIAELRPAVGSVVAVARFALLKPVNVLDMTRFASPGKNGDVFSEDHIRRLGQYRFMQRFMEEIRKPVFASDEHLDYIPTQAVAEYLVHGHQYFSGGKRLPIDGIIYSSAQSPDGRNIALLGEAAHVNQKPGKDSQSPSRRLGRRESSARLAVVADSLSFHCITEAKFGSAPFSYRSPMVRPARDEDDYPF